MNSKKTEMKLKWVKKKLKLDQCWKQPLQIHFNKGDYSKSYNSIQFN